MKSLQLNDSGDLSFDGINNLRMVHSLGEVKQRLRLTIQTNLGEWFLNLRFGYPWIELLSENEPESRFIKELIKILNNDPAIDEIIEVNTEIKRNDRKLILEFSCIADKQQFRERVVI